jgi:peptidoglycan/xylan/chitin deacetylase (PgdA/CDA1 family)
MPNHINMHTSHGIMFHHFHSSNIPKSQGSISKKSLEKIIDYLVKNFNLLDAEKFNKKAINKSLNDKDVCLTFDDALLSQYNVALPVLETKGIQAYFFIYTSIFSDKPEYLEVFTYFRNNFYINIEEFYDHFFTLFKNKNTKLFEEASKFVRVSSYLSNFEFYSFNDRLFRYIRDNILKKIAYEKLMKKLMLEKNTDLKKIIPLLWLSKKQLIDLNDKNHIIGLHSHNHPTMIHKYSYLEQEYEYNTNYRCLSKILSYEPISVSHPCGNYNQITLDILKNKGINVGFRSNMDKIKNYTMLEIPREDHSNLIKEIK